MMMTMTVDNILSGWTLNLVFWPFLSCWPCMTIFSRIDSRSNWTLRGKTSEMYLQGYKSAEDHNQRELMKSCSKSLCSIFFATWIFQVFLLNESKCSPPCLSDNFLKGLKQNSHTSTKSDGRVKEKKGKYENCEFFQVSTVLLKSIQGSLLSLNVTAEMILSATSLHNLSCLHSGICAYIYCFLVRVLQK